jgi:hypothetical protein
MKWLSFPAIAVLIVAASAAGPVQAQLKPIKDTDQTTSSKIGPLTVETLDGGKFKGSLLYADDSLLVLWQGSQPFDETSLSASAKAFHISALGGVTVGPGGHVLKGIGSGLLVGALIGGGIGLASGDDPSSEFISFTAGEKALILGIPSAVIGMLVGGMAGATIHDPHYPIAGDGEFYAAFLRAMGATGSGGGHIGSIDNDPGVIERTLLWARVNAFRTTP